MFRKIFRACFLIVGLPFALFAWAISLAGVALWDFVSDEEEPFRRE